MIANAAFLAAMTVVLFVGWLAGELAFLAPYKTALFTHHAILIGIGLLVVFVNLCALYYTVARWLFLRETGQKLAHVDRQMGTSDTILDDLQRQLDA